ncbi:MAG: methylated-DNA--[protein]-cysteine S-methyltransferase [Bacteroidales bacterium]|nr:methylated-DNA--[protein]-cysteine S-methyltransferase [Bacteroidales bacterium]
MDYIWHYHSPLGGITMASDGEALCGLWFDGQKFFGAGLSQQFREQRLQIFDDTCRWLDSYFSGKAPDTTPKLDMRATPFRKAIWELLLTIPYGQTMTYGELASRYAGLNGLTKMSAQAVGNAVAHNSISIIIPCHRVVGTDGTLTGYAAGLDKKNRLLQLERSLPA